MIAAAILRGMIDRFLGFRARVAGPTVNQIGNIPCICLL